MLDRLEFLIALAREKHFGRAAESCGVAQPTLSIGIQGLEEMFNVPLVKRSSRFKGFTPEGERVLVWAQRLVGDAQAMRQEILGLQTGIGAHIRIASIPFAMPIVSKLTMPFQERHPGARFTVLARPSDVVVDLLHHREIDAGVTYLDNDPIGEAIKLPLYRDTFVLLTRGNGTLGQEKGVTWADVAGLPLCLLTRDMQPRRIIDNVLRGQKLEPVPQIETDSASALLSHVRTGRWVSIVPLSMVQTMHLSDDLRAIPICGPEVAHTIGLVVSERFAIQPTIVSLMDEARALCPPDLVDA
jgi:DNA-binding transcriptional LysR family regulator